ncbi:MAG: c-type cytochrome [Deltaproteobacteria bacterium]|nr:c-type cytochrome [Deltaproteobacteria bacterium]
MKYFKTAHRTLVLGLGLLAMAKGAWSADDAGEIRARKLINAQGCKACHVVDGVGGSLGPNLDLIQPRLTPDETEHKLVNHQRQHADSRVPDFSHLSGDEITILIKFLHRPSPP